MIQRIVSGGLYFYLQGEFGDRLGPVLQGTFGQSDTMTAAGVGLTAGALNGMCLNQLATVKYQMWNQGRATSFMEAATTMWRGGGFAPFVKVHACARKETKGRRKKKKKEKR